MVLQVKVFWIVLVVFMKVFKNFKIETGRNARTVHKKTRAVLVTWKTN